MLAHAMSNTAPAIADKKIQRDVFWGIDIQSRHKGAQTGMGAVQINVRSEAADHTQPVGATGVEPVPWLNLWLHHQGHPDVRQRQ